MKTDESKKKKGRKSIKDGNGGWKKTQKKELMEVGQKEICLDILR